MPTAATAAARRSHASARHGAATLPTGPRRVSGPSRPGSKKPRQRNAVAAPRPLGFRIVEAIHRLSEHRLVDRLVRGRAWIAIVGVGLIGIVFMQVSMLRMNTGISEAVQRSSVLERQNAALEANISRLGSSETIRNAAARAGMIPAADATNNFLDASSLSMRRAVKGITAPDTTPDPVTTSQTSALAASAAKAKQVAETAATGTTATGTTAAAAAGTTTGTTTTATGTAATGTASTGTTATTGAAAGRTTQTSVQSQAQTPTPQPNPSATIVGGAAATGP